MKEMRFITFILGTSTLLMLPASGAAQVSLDPSLLKDWTRTSSYPCPPPFKATYSKDGRILTFIAADHVFGPAEEVDPRLSLIKKEIEKFRPEGLVVERPVVAGSFLGKSLASEEKRCRLQPNKFDCGEPTYAGIVAGRLGASVVGGEQTPDERNLSLSKKLTREELLVYNSVWILSSMREEGVNEDNRRSKFMASLRREMQVGDSEWSYAKLDNWLRVKMAARADDAETSWIEPLNDSTASPTQKIAAKYSSVRERNILKTVEGLMNQKKKTMVVYGAGHFVKQSAVYAKALGIPKIECLSGPGQQINGTPTEAFQ